MIAILPLLFANGHPVALNNFTAAELEKFITFMVTCSWGHDTANAILQPPWWPEGVPFSHPFTPPPAAELPRNWVEMLKNVVRKCYDFHKSTFLLVFSAQLARNPRHKLRYVDNRDHTTSLYDKRNGKLLVTFRNENLYYDAKPILLDDDDEDTPMKSVDDDTTDEISPLVEEEVQIKSDIYLCDNCDSHFDNLHVLKAHERLCNSDNIPSSTCSGGLPEFLSALKLLPMGADKTDSINADTNYSESKSKFVRSAANIDRGPPYPFSSLAYMRNAKNNIQRDSTYSRERVERYCCTDPISSKVVSNKGKNTQFPVRYRRPIDYWYRKHTFPDQRKKKILDVNGQLLYLKCRPISVNVERMSKESMEEFIENCKKEAERKAELVMEKDIVFVDGVNYEQNETEVNMDPLKRGDSECEVIDLCSDEEGGSANENCDPRAGVTCVMRGGAVLRRTAAAAPRALPAEPCGARHRSLPAILQPHPVILIAHTLNTLHTISLE